MSKMICPVHERSLVLQSTRYGDRWHCNEPECTVACWSGSTSTPADAETRKARHDCHGAFDPLWKGPHGPFYGRGGRSRAYKWLRKEMGLSISKAHIGMFDLEQCRKLLAIIRDQFSSKPGVAGKVG